MNLRIWLLVSKLWCEMMLTTHNSKEKGMPESDLNLEARAGLEPRALLAGSLYAVKYVDPFPSLT